MQRMRYLLVAAVGIAAAPHATAQVAVPQPVLAWEWLTYGRVTAQISKPTLGVQTRTGKNQNKVSVFQPKTAPHAGLELGNAFASLSYQHSLPIDTRGDLALKSRAESYRFTSYWRWATVDVFYEKYRGFFLSRLNAGDLRPFRDALLVRNADDAVLPRMSHHLKGMDMTFYLFNRVPLKAVMEQSQHVRGIEYDFSLQLGYLKGSYTNPGPILLDVDGDTGRDFRGLTYEQWSLLPGASFVYGDNWLIGGSYNWGLNYENSQWNGMSDQNVSQFSYGGLIRVAITRPSENSSYGIAGIKHFTKSEHQDLALTLSYTHVEIFYRHSLR